jgi:hypothetical protein
MAGSAAATVATASTVGPTATEETTRHGDVERMSIDGDASHTFRS